MTDSFSRDVFGRLNGFVEPTKVALLHSPEFQSVGIVTGLLDPATREPNGETLVLQLAPREAVFLARQILALAKERSWQMPETPAFETPVDPDKIN